MTFAEDISISSYLEALAGQSHNCTPHSIEELFDRIFIDQMSHKPQTLTGLGFFEGFGLHNHNRYLNDLSIEGSYQQLKLAKSYLISLQAYPKENLSSDQKLSCQIISWQLSKIIEGERFLFHRCTANQINEMLKDLIVLFWNFQPLNNLEELDNYIIRLIQIKKQFQQVIARMQCQTKEGINPSRSAIVKATASIKRLIEVPIECNLFYLRLNGQPEEFLQRAKQAIETEVYPAYRLLQGLLDECLKNSKNEDGIWALPNGDAYYAHLLTEYTALDLTAEKIHEIGLEEVERIEKKIIDLLKQQGLWNQDDSIGEHFQQLNSPKFYFTNTENGRQHCLNKFDEILNRAEKKLGPLFPEKPKAFPIIQQVSMNEEKWGAAYYNRPSINGSHPGVFFVNFADPQMLPSFQMETIAIHEGIPGHHYQRSLQRESDNPVLRKLFENTAYVEGWALYAEMLAYEEGFFSSPFDQIGHLQTELLRAARLVIDTGIHWKRWSREEAIAYMTRVTRLPYSSVVAEIENCFIVPGKACSYKIGQMKILELREEEKRRLGDKFDLKKFHGRILNRGVLPLSML